MFLDACWMSARRLLDRVTGYNWHRGNSRLGDFLALPFTTGRLQHPYYGHAFPVEPGL